MDTVISTRYGGVLFCPNADEAEMDSRVSWQSTQRSASSDCLAEGDGAVLPLEAGLVH